MMDRGISHLVPVEVLDEYDGPCLFTFRNDFDDLLLAYRYTEETDEAPPEFIAAPFDETGVEDLKNGRMTIRDALLQRWTWTVSGHIGGAASMTQLRIAELDPATLPGTNSVLRTAHLPLLGLRVKGERIHPGNVPVSVIRYAVNAAEGAIKNVGEYVAETMPSAADLMMTGLRELHVQRMAFASFEVALRNETPISKAEDGDPMGRVRQLLSGAVRAASTRTSLNLADSFGDEEAGKVALGAILNMTPPGWGAIEETEVSGRLVGGPRVHRLDRESRSYVRSFFRPNPEEIVDVVGTVDVPDKKKRIFTVRSTNSTDSTRFTYDDEHFDEVADAFADDGEYRVVGKKVSASRPAKLVAISKVSRGQPEG